MLEIHAVPFSRVRFVSGLLRERIDVNRRATIPVAFAQCEASGRFWNFERAASALRGETLSDRRPPGYPFDDTDVYKILEGASYALAVQGDPELDKYLDECIVKIAAAQEPDGYLYTTRTICPEEPHPWATAKRWDGETDLSHELYNLGHLYEAAAAHFEATGKRSLLEIAIRSADLLVRTFGPKKRSIWPGHPITEMGLARLAQATGNKEYLELACFLLDERGPDGKTRSGDPYNQSHLPVREQSAAVGHAVRAMYLYAGMADATIQGVASYAGVLKALWDDVVAHKLYLTGGIGAIPAHEGFGEPDELPNGTAYCETCASIGLVYFCLRMFLLNGNASAIDVLERVLYNGLLSGVSLDGRNFFYPNPLESKGDIERKAWFGCACCPGNITRFLASAPGYAIAQRGQTVYVNLFSGCRADVTLEDGRSLEVAIDTAYPWEGNVRITLGELSAPTELTLNIRIPGWARGEVLPSDLYRFLNDRTEPVLLTVNGKPVPLVLEHGFAVLRRVWRSSDHVELVLPMPIQRVIAHERVTADRGRMALQRGPIVYALEGRDHVGGEVLNLCVADDVAVDASVQPGWLDDGVMLNARAVRLSARTDGTVERSEVALTAIPYFAWANRGPSEMMVWIPRSEADAWVRPAPSAV